MHKPNAKGDALPTKMIFHKPTQTAIFTPTKTGSVSLRLMTFEHLDFEVVYGPAPWNHKQMTPHVASHDVDVVDDLPIHRRVLLFRDPIARTVSLWRHSWAKNECEPWDEWLDVFDAVGGWQPQTAYCENPDDLLRSESLASELHRITGVELRERRENVSSGEVPIVTAVDMAKIRERFAVDFAFSTTALAADTTERPTIRGSSAS
jgi:hypothetical protein